MEAPNNGKPQFNEIGFIDRSAGVTLPPACRPRSSCSLILP